MSMLEAILGGIGVSALNSVLQTAGQWGLSGIGEALSAPGSENWKRKQLSKYDAQIRGASGPGSDPSRQVPRPNYNPQEMGPAPGYSLTPPPTQPQPSISPSQMSKAMFDRAGKLSFVEYEQPTTGAAAGYKPQTLEEAIRLRQAGTQGSGWKPQTEEEAIRLRTAGSGWKPMTKEEELELRMAGRSAGRGRITPEEVGAMTKARIEAKTEAERNMPLTKFDITNLRHPETLEPARMGMTRGEAQDQGYISVSPPQIVAMNALDNTESILSEVFSLADKLITADGPAGALAQRASLSAGAFAKTNPTAATYNDSRQSFIGVISRTMGGERGVLTDRDITRINDLLPNFGDTATIKNMKKDMIGRILVAAKTATRKNIFGQAATSERAELDSLFKQADQILAGSAEPSGKSSPASGSAPTLDQFIEAASKANPGASEEDLKAYWEQKYGGR